MEPTKTTTERARETAVERVISNAECAAQLEITDAELRASLGRAIADALEAERRACEEKAGSAVRAALEGYDGGRVWAGEAIEAIRRAFSVP